MKWKRGESLIVKFKCEGSPRIRYCICTGAPALRIMKAWCNSKKEWGRERQRERERGEIFPSVGLHHKGISCVKIAYAHLCLCAIRSPKANLFCCSLWSYIKFQVILDFHLQAEIGNDAAFLSRDTAISWTYWLWLNLPQIPTRVIASSTADFMNTLTFNIQRFILN